MPESFSSTNRSKETEINNGFNLTKAKIFGRQSLKIFGGLIIFLMVGRFLWNAGVQLYISLNPPPPPPPTVGFDRLPALVFTPQGIERPKEYVLETAQGRFPEFSDRAEVYYVPQAQQSLLSEDQGAVTAKTLGFQGKPEQLTQLILRFKQAGIINETLDLNTVTNNLKYTTDYLARPELQTGRQLATTFDAVSATKSFFNRADLLPQDVEKNEGRVTFIKVVGGVLQEAVSLSDAQLLYVELSRSSIGADPEQNLPGIQPIRSDGSSSTLRALVAMLSSGIRVVQAERDYFPVDYAVMETYPIRTANQAWTAFKGGEGIVASGTFGEKATVRSVELRYFESENYQKYFQPVYVFTGDNNFIGIVSAVLPEWTIRE